MICMYNMYMCICNICTYIYYFIYAYYNIQAIHTYRCLYIYIYI